MERNNKLVTFTMYMVIFACIVVTFPVWLPVILGTIVIMLGLLGQAMVWVGDLNWVAIPVIMVATILYLLFIRKPLDK